MPPDPAAIRTAILTAVSGGEPDLDAAGVETERELIECWWRDGLVNPGDVFESHELSGDDYHHRMPGVSSSSLKRIDESIISYLDSLEPEAPTVPLIVGRAFNDCLIEPIKWAERYQAVDPVNRLTNAEKERVAQVRPGALFVRMSDLTTGRGNLYVSDGAALLPVEDDTEIPEHAPVLFEDPVYEQLVQLRLGIMRHEVAGRIFQDDRTIFEQSMFVLDESTGLLLKVRPDMRLPSGYIGDLKTAYDGSMSAFKSMIFSKGYYRQAAFYTDVARWCGFDVAGFFWLVASKDRPTEHGVALRYPHPEFMRRGRKENRASLEALARWVEEAEDKGLREAWPGYPKDFEEVPYYRTEDVA